MTYNIAKDWDVATIIKNCTETKFEGVELRTTHKHGVEVTLAPAQRAEVKKRFADSPVKLWSMGSAFDFHTPDQTKLRQDIAATKEYIVLSPRRWRDGGQGGVPTACRRKCPPKRPSSKSADRSASWATSRATTVKQIRLEVHGPATSLVPNIKRIMDVADHPLVGACWNCNQSDIEGAGFDANFDLLKKKDFHGAPPRTCSARSTRSGVCSRG